MSLFLIPGQCEDFSPFKVVFTVNSSNHFPNFLGLLHSYLTEIMVQLFVLNQLLCDF